MADKSAWGIAFDQKKTTAQRDQALESSQPTKYSPEELDQLAELVADRDCAEKLRNTALRMLFLARFSNPNFPKWRRKFTTLLVKLMNDPTPAFREAGLSELAKAKHPDAQKRLLAGLKNPAEAPMAVTKALQLLRYDVHSDAFPIARELAMNSEDAQTRQAALRLLAADPGAAGLFEKLLLDKKETPEIRRVCAVAFNNLKPKAYQARAQQIVLDDDEDHDLQAQSLAALTNFVETAALDAPVTAKVKELKSQSPERVKKAARQYLQKHDTE